ncbi:hypothetical protein [Algoriphagus sanaruensis]|uniref:Conjugative transposon TraJ C-terminal domain-containing protein n=1 Tax=Algoriphagus sanaruensis TaxID=1727163 RepID=A0A142ESH1_9BACT|nr:hypothetical protein [Algoriphagus sanaruensis]AMQ58076.1 hypothetical protein AO498_16610 [Algoriphagus sanaruensis]
MKPFVLAFAIMAFSSFLGITKLAAQEVIVNSTLSKEEQKAIIKLQKAKEELEKSKTKLFKLEETYDKKRQRLDKKNAQGKLSPNDIAKETKAIEKLGKKIDKEKERIKELELFLQENESI